MWRGVSEKRVCRVGISGAVRFPIWLSGRVKEYDFEVLRLKGIVLDDDTDDDDNMVIEKKYKTEWE